LWTGAVSGGYGHLKINGKNVQAHRVMYTLFNGIIFKGLTVDHKCRVRNCVNPKHLRLLTSRDNILCGTGEAAKNHRKTHCLRGHKLSGENLRVSVSGRRLCRTCVRAWGRYNYHKKKDPRPGVGSSVALDFKQP
jgi:hypothetical protein